MQCDATSPLFMTRARHRDMFLSSSKLGALSSLDFFLRLKRIPGAMVLTDTSVQVKTMKNDTVNLIPSMGQQATVMLAQRHTFFKSYAVDVILDRDSGHKFAVCTNRTCDARIVETLLEGKSWSTIGVTMPNFAYNAYIRIFQSAVKFLEKNKVPYFMYGGSELGFFKLGRLLPWDSGDVDFVVNTKSIGCQKWLQMLRGWGDEHGFIHPHVSPAGAKCSHFGVYVKFRSSESFSIYHSLAHSLISLSLKNNQNVRSNVN